MVICVAILGICILSRIRNLKEENHDKSIVRDIYGDLIHMFYFKKPGKFLGPLEPLNNINVLKNLVMVEDNESYTINKKIIHLCTREPTTGSYYDKNTLMFVVLHELAHVLCNDVGHTENFSIINQALIDHAIKHGFYDPSKPFVKNYCGIK
jgi:hypothetical protein